MVAALLALTLAPPVQAQYSNPWADNNNAYFNRATAYQKAGALRKKARRSHHSHVSKSAKKRTGFQKNTPPKSTPKK